MLPAAENRGQVLATSNAISFLLMAVGSVLYKLFRPLFGDSPQYIFVVCAGIGILAFLVTLTIHLPSESNDTMKRL
jgi:hypothetical protein